uniref:Uncharacterized protein n=1 Tax=Rhizophora mucronata TaxID=61149 RepID=A0A2P2L527_RHIMU
MFHLRSQELAIEEHADDYIQIHSPVSHQLKCFKNKICSTTCLSKSKFTSIDYFINIVPKCYHSISSSTN